MAARTAPAPWPASAGPFLKAQETFVPTERDNVLASAHELIVDEAPWVWIVHDLNPRAMSAKVKGFRPAQSWFQDFTSVYMD